MTEQEYENELAKLRKRHNSEINNLYVQYANENDPYKVGDIITGYAGTIRIESVKVGISMSKFPENVYSGTRMKKDGSPRKKHEIYEIWQSNITP